MTPILSRLREAGSAAEASSSFVYAAWTGSIFISSRNEAIKVHICTKHCNVRRKQHPHSDASMAIQRPQHSPKILKRAVERVSQFEPTKLRRPSVSQDNFCKLCAPQTSSSCRQVQNKEFQPISWHQFPPPFCLFTQLGQSLDVRRLCNATLWGSLLEVAVAVVRCVGI